ncbi:MAG: glycosyltransferase [Gemmatimonadaceae bacterium]
MRPPAMHPELSVVVATYNRPDGIIELLRDLNAQEGFPRGSYEVIVVDDGSPTPVRPMVESLQVDYPLTFIEQENAGQGAARHHGITRAIGSIVVILDDDMRLAPGFLAAHRAAHNAGGEVVQGAIVPPATRSPLFERWHATQLVRFADEIRNGHTHMRGAHLATGNVSFRKELYVKVGGFDPALRRSEDRDLGIRFEQSGAVLAFSQDAQSVHHTDHVSLSVWLGRAFNYGVYDSRIAEKLADIEYVDPWRFIFAVSFISRPFMFVAAGVPLLGKMVSRTAMPVALFADRLGFERLALAGTAFVYGLEYFRGVRSAAGSLKCAARGFGRYLVKRSRERRGSGRGAPLSAWKDFRRAVATDHSIMTEGRAKYLGETSARSWPADVTTKVGLQMLFWIRVMRLFRDCGLGTLARISSRLIRHVYSAEIHWDAEISPGASIIHGNGLVISHSARVGEGAVLCQGVTLGMGIDADTGVMGAPTLQANVHVGPGATLIGPIIVGQGSKIMAGSVLNRSVPPYSLVRPAAVEVVSRERRSLGGVNGSADSGLQNDENLSTT